MDMPDKSILLIFIFTAGLYCGQSQCDPKLFNKTAQEAFLVLQTDQYKKGPVLLSQFINTHNTCAPGLLLPLIDSLLRYCNATEDFTPFQSVFSELHTQRWDSMNKNLLELLEFRYLVDAWKLDEAQRLFDGHSLINNLSKLSIGWKLSEAVLIGKKFKYDSLLDKLNALEPLLQHVPPDERLAFCTLKAQTLYRLNQAQQSTPYLTMGDSLMDKHRFYPSRQIEFMITQAEVANRTNRAKCIELAEKTLHYVYLQSPCVKEKYLPSILTVLAINYRDNFKIRKSDTLISKVFPLLDSSRNSHQRQFISASLVYANNKTSLSQLDESIHALERALLENRRLKHANTRMDLSILNYLANTHSRKKEYHLALQYSQSCLEMAKQMNDQGYSLHPYYRSMITFYTYLDDTTYLRKYLTEWENHFYQFEKSVSDIHQCEFITAQLIGYIFLNEPTRYIQRAETFKRQAKNVSEGNMEELNIYLADSYYNSGNYQLGYQSLKNKYETDKARWIDNPNEQNLHHFASSFKQMFIISWENYVANPNTENQLENQMAQNELAAYLSNLAKDHPENDAFHNSKLSMTGIIDTKVSQYLYFRDPQYIWDALAIQEIYYGRNLVRNKLRNIAYTSCVSGPDQVKNKATFEAYLSQKELMYHTHPLGSIQPTYIDKKLVDVIQDDEIDKTCYDNWMNYEIKGNIRHLLDDLLAKDDCLLTFNLHEGYLSTFFISLDTVIVVRSVVPDLLVKIDSFNNNHNRYFHFGHLGINVPQYADLSYSLYKHMILPIRSMLKKNVLIKQSNNFQSIPFESLIESTPTNPSRLYTWSFLSNKHTISYLSSFNMYHLSRTTGMPASEPAVLFAPFSESDSILIRYSEDMAMNTRSILKPLASSAEEIKSIQKLTNGKAFIGKFATKNKFIEEASTSKTIHIASHGNFDSLFLDRSYLSFKSDSGDAPGKLFYGRLKEMNLQADLVTISACFSGMGYNALVENNASIAQAFIIAGAKNVVSALWAIPDQPTKELMILFYKEIKLGKSYAQALTDAKKNFILKFKQWSHPVYWAGFILNGR